MNKPSSVTRPYIVAAELEKIYARRPGDAASHQIRSISDEAVKKTPGWRYDLQKVKSNDKYRSGGGGFDIICKAKILFQCTVSDADNLQQVELRAKRIICDLIKAAEHSSKNWNVISATAPNQKNLDLEECRNIKNLYGHFETALFHLPDSWEEHFKDDIYGLDPQIRLMWDALKSCVRSGHIKRSHICFHGPPGCGKTTVSTRICDVIEEISPEGAVLRLTASQTTKAGLENLLIDMNPKPSLIEIEEIDKAWPENLTGLLDVCNTSGSIKKTNAVRGNVDIPLQALVICTVNDVPKFKSFLSGALASRFAHKIFFPRPNEKVLKLIAQREVRKHKGDIKWIKKSLEIMKREGTNDPRRLIAILDGCERLLDGSWEQDMKHIRDTLLAESDALIEQEKNRVRLHRSLDLDDI